MNDKNRKPAPWYCVIDRDSEDDLRFSTTDYESLDACKRERDRLALKYGKERCLGIGRITSDGKLEDITEQVGIQSAKERTDEKEKS